MDSVYIYACVYVRICLRVCSPPFPAPFGNSPFPLPPRPPLPINGMRPPMPNMPFMQPPNPSVRPQATPPADDYTQTAAFNKRSGRFKFAGFGKMPAHLAGKGADNIAVKQHWANKGIAADSQGRQMGHFFDFDQWQEQMQPNKRRRQ